MESKLSVQFYNVYPLHCLAWVEVVVGSSEVTVVGGSEVSVVGGSEVTVGGS